MASTRLSHSRSRLVALAIVSSLAAVAAPSAQQPAPPVFRAGTSLVTVDVVVRDASGAVVRGLTAADFTLLEDGRPQTIDTFTFQQIADRPGRVPQADAVLVGLERQARDGAPPQRPAYSSDAFAGRRALVLLFDLSSLQPEDVQRSSTRVFVTRRTRWPPRI